MIFSGYDEATMEHDYPIAKNIGKIYSQTVELQVTFPA